MSKSGRWQLRCPDCGSRLVVDATTGEILAHKKPGEPLAGGRDLDSLFAEMEEGRSRAEETFEREVEAMKDRDRLLEEKFREAVRRAREEPDEEKPTRPFDLD